MSVPTSSRGYPTASATAFNPSARLSKASAPSWMPLSGVWNSFLPELLMAAGYWQPQSHSDFWQPEQMLVS